MNCAKAEAMDQRTVGWSDLVEEDAYQKSRYLGIPLIIYGSYPLNYLYKFFFYEKHFRQRKNCLSKLFPLTFIIFCQIFISKSKYISFYNVATVFSPQILGFYGNCQIVVVIPYGFIIIPVCEPDEDQDILSSTLGCTPLPQLSLNCNDPFIYLIF